MDKYSCFQELAQNEDDFTFDICDRNSSVTILAPHGGEIEPHTTEIVKLIAGYIYNYYCFNGKKEGNNSYLHITSHRYDEKQAVVLVEKSLTVITVHGSSRREPVIFLGGLDIGLINRIAAEFAATDIAVDRSGMSYGGTHKENICNRGLTGKGVQIECSRPLRDSPVHWQSIAAAVRRALRVSSSS